MAGPRTVDVNKFLNRFDPSGAVRQNYLQSPTGIAKSLISQGQQSGAFGPDYLVNLLRQQAMRTADATRRRTSVLSRLYGLDPSQRRVAAVNADIGANQTLAGLLGNASLQGRQGYQDFLRQLFSGQLSYEQQRALQKQQQKAQSKGGIGSAIGGIAGTLIGGPLGGGVGSALGGLFGGGGGGGGSMMGQSGFQYPYQGP